jgi:hypothetical protein
MKFWTWLAAPAESSRQPDGAQLLQETMQVRWAGPGKYPAGGKKSPAGLEMWLAGAENKPAGAA